MCVSFICLWYLHTAVKINQQIIQTSRLIIPSEIILAHMNYARCEGRVCKSKVSLKTGRNKLLINKVLGCLQKCFWKY